MLDGLRRDLSGWADVVIAVVSLVVAVFVALADRKQRCIAHAVLSNTRLAVGQGPFSLRVSYNDRKLRDPHSVVLRVSNFGRAVPSGDFETPLTIDMSPALIAACEITFTSPPGLQPVLTLATDSCARIEPLLLNRGDLFEVTMLVDGRVEQVRLGGRIVGIPGIEAREVPRTSWGDPWRMGRFGALIGWLLVIGPSVVGLYVMAALQSWSGTFLGAVLLASGVTMYRWGQLHLYRSSEGFLRSK